MEQKLKFILIGLIGVSIIFIFLFIATLTSKQAITRERDDLAKENTSLSSKIGKLEQGARSYETKLASLNNEFKKVSQEKQEIEKKYELANKEKGELIERLKTLKAKGTSEAQAAQQAQALPLAADAYWAGILQDKTTLELQAVNLMGELKSLQINNEQLQREKNALDLDLNGLKREKEDLQRLLDYNQKTMDSIARELVREKNDKMQIQDSAKSIKNENTILTRQLKSLNSRKINLDKKIQELQSDKAALERRFAEMESMLSDKVSKITELKEQLEAITSGAKTETPIEKSQKQAVELPPIVVRPQAESPEREREYIETQAAGRILAVNKESNFVIIDSGEDAGVKAGDIFQVYKENKSIATIEVIQTRKSIAACDIKRESSPIKIGDAVR